MGEPQNNVGINFRVAKGAGGLSSGTGNTNNTGYASTTVHIENQNSDVQVTACVAPANSPCQTFTLFATPVSSWRLETVSGSSQVIPAGQPFQPVVLRITDGVSPSNPVMGVNLSFEITLERIPKNGSGGGGGDDGGGGGGGMPVILGIYQAQATTAELGLATMLPSVQDVQGYCDVVIVLTSGPLKSRYHLHVVESMGGESQGQSHHDVGRLRDEGRKRTQGRE